MAGRPIGAVGKRTLEAIAMAERYGTHPLEFLLGRMVDVKQDMVMRVDCAKASLPYLLPRLNAVDMRVKHDERSPKEIMDALDHTLERMASNIPSVIEHESLRPSNERVEGQRDLLGASVPVNERGRDARG